MAVAGACVTGEFVFGAKGFEKMVLDPVLLSSPPKGQTFSTALQPLRTSKAALVAAMFTRRKAIDRLGVQAIIRSNMWG